MTTHPVRDDINLLDGNWYRGEPHETWTWMRAHAPVYYDEGSAVWAITRYADVLAVEKDPVTFSSQRSPRPHGDPLPMMISMDDPLHHRRAEAGELAGQRQCQVLMRFHDFRDGLMGIIRVECKRPMPEWHADVIQHHVDPVRHGLVIPAMNPAPQLGANCSRQAARDEELFYVSVSPSVRGDQPDV